MYGFRFEYGSENPLYFLSDSDSDLIKSSDLTE